jgi:hypothetical protein
MTRAHPLQLPPTAAPRSPATSPPERERSHPQRLSSLKDMGRPHVQLPPWCPTATSSAKRGRLRPQVSYLGATTPPPLICSTVTIPQQTPSRRTEITEICSVDESRRIFCPQIRGSAPGIHCFPAIVNRVQSAGSGSLFSARAHELESAFCRSFPRCSNRTFSFAFSLYYCLQSPDFSSFRT